MKKVLLLGSMVTAGLLPVTASAADKVGPYVTFSGQAVFAEKQDIIGGLAELDYDTGFGIGTALGYDLPGSGLRLEGEITYRYNEANISSPFTSTSAEEGIDSLAYMANVYYDFDTNSRFIPYVGAGIGAVDVDGEEVVFGYQGMAGVAYNLDNQSEIYGGYRYLATEDVDLGGIEKLEYTTHSVEVGYRLRF